MKRRLQRLIRCFQSAHLFDGFELWEGARVLIGHPQRRRAARGPLLDRADKMKGAILAKVSEKLVKFGFERFPQPPMSPLMQSSISRS
jgi:hypothetical protein